VNTSLLNKDLELYGFHGYFDEEQRLGRKFLFNVNAKLAPAENHRPGGVVKRKAQRMPLAMCGLPAPKYKSILMMRLNSEKKLLGSICHGSWKIRDGNEIRG
jgi:hypothetical protein